MNTERLVWLVILIACIILILWLLLRNGEVDEEQLIIHEATQMDGSRETGEGASADTVVTQSPLSMVDIQRFRDKGLRDPENDIRRHLFENPEVIPAEGDSQVST